LDQSNLDIDEAKLGGSFLSFISENKFDASSLAPAMSTPTPTLDRQLKTVLPIFVPICLKFHHQSC
jgi:hypothetical protein